MNAEDNIRETLEFTGHALRLVEDAPTFWTVWLDTEGDVPFDGVCIGTGATRDEAVQDAVRALESVLAKLQETPSPEAEAKLRAQFDTGDQVLRDNGSFESLTEPTEEPDLDWPSRSYGGTA